MNTYADCFAHATKSDRTEVSVDVDCYSLGKTCYMLYNRNTFVFRVVNVKIGRIVTFNPDESVREDSFNPNGCILYSGPSAWDGEPIVVVLTGLTDVSANTKTADMLQTWIIRQDRKPHVARQDGSDSSVCGDCPHRSGSCYVNLGQGPRAVWECYANGAGYLAYTPCMHDSLIAGRKVRIGSYGDPAMVPVETFLPILALSSGHTGYTHQWDKFIGADYRTVCMASCDTVREAHSAQLCGWRSFTVTPGLLGPTGSVLCPASEEGGHRTTCDRCGLCMGAAKPTVPSVVIPVHGNEMHKSIYHNKTVAAIGAI